MAYARDIKAGRASVELTTKDKLQRGLARARARLKYFAQDVQAMGTTMVGAATGLLAPMAAALKVFSEIGDGAAKMARRTGLSGEAVQSLGFAAKRSGTDLQSLEKGVRRMQRTVWDAERGLSTAEDALSDLSLTVDDLSGKKPEEQFMVLADALSRVDDESRRAAIAQQIFGRSGTMLLPMFEQGRQGIEDLQRQFEDLGVTLSDEDLAAAERFTDTLGDLWTAAKYGVALLGAGLEPAIRDLTSAAGDWLKEAADWVRNNRALIVQYGKLALHVGKWLAIIGGGLVVVGKLTGGIVGLVGVVKLLSGALLALGANPLGWFAANIAAIVVAYEIAVRHAADLKREQQGILANADRERATDLAKLDRLREIQAKHEKTNADIAEAQRLVDELQGRYGDLGLAVNKTTGEVSGLAGAMGQLAEGMQQVVAVQLQKALIEARRNLQELRKEREAKGKSLMHGFSVIGTWLAGGDIDEGIQAMLDREREAAETIVDLKRRLEDLMSGRKDALTGGAEGSAAGAVTGALEKAGERAAEAQADTERRLLDRLVRLRIEAGDDEHARALALIRQRYAEERQQLEQQGASAEAIHRLLMAQEQELYNTRMDHQRKIFAEAERQAQEWYAEQERQAEVEQRLRDEIERQEIVNSLKGAEREKALLDLERRQRLGETETEAQRKYIEDLYRLKVQAIQAADEVSTRLSAGKGTFGSLRAGASLAVASVAERTARATEQTAENTRRLVEQARRGGLVFG